MIGALILFLEIINYTQNIFVDQEFILALQVPEACVIDGFLIALHFDCAPVFAVSTATPRHSWFADKQQTKTGGFRASVYIPNLLSK